MPKKNIPVDQKTLDTLAQVPADAIFEHLAGLLNAAENAENEVALLKEQDQKIPQALRRQSLEAGHLRRLREQIRKDPGHHKALSQVVAATQMSKDAEDEAKYARQNRERNLHILNARYKVQKTEMYTKYDIGRAKLNKAFDDFSGNVPKTPKEQAWEEADRWHGVYTKAISVEATAREFRNNLFGLLERPGQPGVSNPEDWTGGYSPTDLGRLTGLSGARVTQVRTGSSNAARARKAAELRELKRLKRIQQEQQEASLESEKIGA